MKDIFKAIIKKEQQCIYPKNNQNYLYVLSFVQYFGSAILVLAGAAALMGHLEKAIWSNKKYGEKNAEGVLVNIIGVLIILFISGVTFLVTRFSKEDPKTSVH